MDTTIIPVELTRNDVILTRLTLRQKANSCRNNGNDILADKLYDIVEKLIEAEAIATWKV